MPRARKPPAAVSAIRSAIARAAWGKLSSDERKARQQRVWAKRKAAKVAPLNLDDGDTETLDSFMRRA